MTAPTVLKLRAADVRESDELLVGPQGPVDGNPSVRSIRVETYRVTAMLVGDDGIVSEALWLPETRVTVYRPHHREEPLMHAIPTPTPNGKSAIDDEARVYFAVPQHATIGRPFDTWAEAELYARTLIHPIVGCPGSFTRAWIDVRLVDRSGDRPVYRHELVAAELAEVAS